MICSPRTGGSKSGSNWLDRLRSNKGIPTDNDDEDLDSFLLRLSSHSHSHSHSPQTRPTKPARSRPTEAHDLPLTTLLAQIFNPGATTTLTLTSKKCPRKQTNPKFFLASSSTNAPESTSTPCDAAAVALENRRSDDEEEDDEEREDMKGFTRSEVTVIDTSCPGWKVDKFVFRKNNIWKVRERKQKNKFFAKKKSKTTHEFDIHGIETSKDNIVNIGGEKAVKKQKVIYSTSKKQVL